MWKLWIPEGSKYRYPIEYAEKETGEVFLLDSDDWKKIHETLVENLGKAAALVYDDLDDALDDYLNYAASPGRALRSCIQEIDKGNEIRRLLERKFGDDWWDFVNFNAAANLIDGYNYALEKIGAPKWFADHIIEVIEETLEDKSKAIGILEWAAPTLDWEAFRFGVTDHGGVVYHFGAMPSCWDSDIIGLAFWTGNGKATREMQKDFEEYINCVTGVYNRDDEEKEV